MSQANRGVHHPRDAACRRQMYRATSAAKPSASIKQETRRALQANSSLGNAAVVPVTQLDHLQHASEKLLDFVLGGLVAA